MKYKRKEKAGAELDSWLISYADMITLLLGFFIIFISTSVPDEDKLRAATTGMRQEFGTVSIFTPFDSVYQEMQGIVEQNRAYEQIIVERTEKGLQIELSSNHIFERGVAELRPEKVALLSQIIQSLLQLNYLEYRVIVEAHTDDIPTESTLYTSNWELSAAQAARVARFLAEQGIPKSQLSAAAYADTQPEVPNRDAEGRVIPENQAINRRVQIKLEQQ